MFRVTSARREGSPRTAAPHRLTTPPTPVARLFIRLALALMPALGLATPAAADTTAPMVTGAEVTATEPKVIVLTFDEALDTGSVPEAFSAFRVRVGGNLVSGLGVSSVGIDGTDATKVKLGLSVALDAGQKDVTVDYTYTNPDSNPLQDAADNAVADFTGQLVANNAPPCGPDAAGHPANAYWTACLTLGGGAL